MRNLHPGANLLPVQILHPSANLHPLASRSYTNKLYPYAHRFDLLIKHKVLSFMEKLAVLACIFKSESNSLSSLCEHACACACMRMFVERASSIFLLRVCG